MSFDITKLSEVELIELNRRIVERLQLTDYPAGYRPAR